MAVCLWMIRYFCQVSTIEDGVYRGKTFAEELGTIIGKYMRGDVKSD